MAVSAQAALLQAAARKLLSASCCTQVARHLSSSCSVHVVQVSLCKTLGACICAQDAQPELSCGGAPRTIRLRFRVAIFRSEPLHILRLLCFSQSCHGSGGNRTRDRATAKQTARQLAKAISRVKKKRHSATARALRHARSPHRVRRDKNQFARRHSESASTRTIPAEGTSAHRKKPQVFAPRPRRSPQRVARARQNRKKPRVFAPRPRRSPKRVAGRQNSQKTSQVFVPRPRRSPQKKLSFCKKYPPGNCGTRAIESLAESFGRTFGRKPM